MSYELVAAYCFVMIVVYDVLASASTGSPRVKAVSAIFWPISIVVCVVVVFGFVGFDLVGRVFKALIWNKDEWGRRR